MTPTRAPSWPWLIAGDSGGGGTLAHLAMPRFRARWTTGEPGLPAEAAWTDAGSGSGADTISIFEIRWADAPPREAVLQRLMEQAAQALDCWIANRL